MHALIAELYPICRSITGEGIRATLRRVQQLIPLTLHEVPTGTPVFDWVVPKEWQVCEAWVKNSAGEKVIDFRQHNLHLLNYSIPVQRTMPLAELKPQLFSLPDQPDLIPYRTSYYRETWGFCLPHQLLTALPDGDYEVLIDTTLDAGHLTYGECYLPGSSSDEVLISCHCCHPSLANDNLSGIALVTFLAQALQKKPRRYSYRLVFIPGTIGSITWLAMNEARVDKIKHGLVVANVGDAGKLHYKKSRRGNAEIDQAVQHLLRHSEQPHEIIEFSPYGYDERQYCSPGFNLAVGSLTRTPYGRFPEYHTSADNLDFVQPAALADSLAMYLAVVDLLERNQKYRNLNPKCEPQLGRRGLYSLLGGRKETKASEMAMLWVLNFGDGEHTLLEIAEKAQIAFPVLADVAETLLAHGLLEPCT